MSGGLGSGKTSIGVFDAIALALAIPKSVHLYATPYWSMITDGVLVEFKKLMEGREHFLENNKSTKIFDPIFKNGSKILFRSYDKDFKPKSINAHFATADEASHFPSYSVIQGIFDRARTPPPDGITPNLYKIITNPDTPDHFLHKLFLEDPDSRPDVEIVHSSTFDNPFLTENYIMQQVMPKMKVDLLMFNRVHLGEWNFLNASAIGYFPHVDRFNSLDRKAYIDPSFDGKCTTAVSICSYNEIDGFTVTGKMFKKSIVDCYYDIVSFLDFHNVATATVEYNADKGSSYNEFKRIDPFRHYTSHSENMNKHARITSFVIYNKHRIKMLDSTDSDFQMQLANYAEGVKPDDCADSLSGAIRMFIDPMKKDTSHLAFQLLPRSHISRLHLLGKKYPTIDSIAKKVINYNSAEEKEKERENDSEH